MLDRYLGMIYIHRYDSYTYQSVEYGGYNKHLSVPINLSDITYRFYKSLFGFFIMLL